MDTFNRARNRVRAITREPSGIGLAPHLPDGSPSPAYALLTQQARGLTYPFNVTAVSQLAFRADFNRKFMFIQNNDPLGIVWLAFGTPAIIGTGMKFSAGGGGILLDNNVPTADIYLIGTIASNQNLTIILG